jgi:outer membrane protein TolC
MPAYRLRFRETHKTSLLSHLALCEPFGRDVALTLRMHVRRSALLAWLAVLAVLPVTSAAQTRLTLDEAMVRARSDTPEARALAAASGEADARVRVARSGFFPRIDVSETVQRGNQPVFVFSSLLSQRRFTEANFAIPALNDPAPITNTRTAVALQQPVFDAGLTRLAVQAARLGREMATVERERAGQDLAVRAAEAYVRVLQLEAANRASAAAVAAADSDLQRARARRDAGVVTEADALMVEVHAADMRQRHISNEGDLAVARIQLAEAVGLPLSEPIELAPVSTATRSVDESLIATALDTRWEGRAADLREQLAANAHRSARAQYLPTFGVEAGWELNGSTFADQRSSWVVGAQVQMNLFRGFADAARAAEARYAIDRASAERERIARSIEVEVRAAIAQLTAARARQDAGRAALTQARESQRIIRDRYESGLAGVTDVLRAAEATLDAESRATAADTDVILRTVALDRALGRL